MWPPSRIAKRKPFSMSGTTYDDAKLGVVSGIFPYAAFELFQKQEGPFSDAFAYCRTREVSEVSVVVHGQASVGSGELVSGGYFRGLGLIPAAGRLIVPQDDRAGAPLVAVISQGFSERLFGEPAAAVGRSILISNLPFTVIGVTPPEFYGVDPAIVSDIYFPMGLEGRSEIEDAVKKALNTQVTASTAADGNTLIDPK